MEEKLLSDPETEEVSEASSSESKVGRRRGVKAPAPPRVNKSTQHHSSLRRCLRWYLLSILTLSLLLLLKAAQIVISDLS